MGQGTFNKLVHEQFWRCEVTDEEGWGRAWAQAEEVKGVIFEDVFHASKEDLSIWSHLGKRLNKTARGKEEGHVIRTLCAQPQKLRYSPQHLGRYFNDVLGGRGKRVPQCELLQVA